MEQRKSAGLAGMLAGIGTVLIGTGTVNRAHETLLWSLGAIAFMAAVVLLVRSRRGRG